MRNEDQQRAQVEKRTREAMAVEIAALRAHEERARWCEEMRADVHWSVYFNAWTVAWHLVKHGPRVSRAADRNAAIDLAREGAK